MSCRLQGGNPSHLVESKRGRLLETRIERAGESMTCKHAGGVLNLCGTDGLEPAHELESVSRATLFLFYQISKKDEKKKTEKESDLSSIRTSTGLQFLTLLGPQFRLGDKLLRI